MRLAAMSEGVLEDVATPAPSTLALDTSLPRRRPFSLDVRLVAAVGRAVLIGFVLFVLDAARQPLTAGDAVGLLAATCAWQCALSRATTSARVVLGSAGAVALGAGAGSAAVAALNGTPVGLHVSVAALVASTAAVFASAYAWEEAIALTSAGRKRVLLVGTSDLELGEDPKRVEIVGTLPAFGELAEIVEARRPDVVVLLDEATYDDAMDQLLDARINVSVAPAPSFYEWAFGRIPPGSISARWFMALFHPRQRPYNKLTNRAFDVAVAAIALALAAPLIAVLALLTKRSTGSALYRQTRVGELGRLFTMYKLSTMRCDAESSGAAFSCNDDPRATRVGALLRRAHLDEIPQLWNVLRGDMSIVGPRPERPEFIGMIEDTVPFWNRRLLVKPGITGWAQVHCGYASDCGEMAEKLSYDLWYLRHRSVVIDAAVCARTLALQLRRLFASRRASPTGA
jgi:lipopolysaccharide/colanic/teichoic acid biosynthesis glycosyltransferase